MGAFDKFTWFDRPGQVSADGTSYTPSQTGGITALGRALSGVGNAFALPYGHGDPNHDIEQQRNDIAQQQADMEFAQHLQKVNIEKGRLDLEKSQVGRQNRLSDAMASLYFGAAGLSPTTGMDTPGAPAQTSPSSLPPANLQTALLTGQGQSPLSAAFPMTGGNMGANPLSNGLNPALMMVPHMSPRGVSLSAQANPIANKMIEQAGTDQMDAAQKTAADLTNLHQVGGVFKTLMQDYDQADKEGLAGGKLQKFKAGAAINPLWKGLDKIIAPQGTKGAAAFTSARNELMVRLNPIWSQQVGTNKAGSNRIMESLINMSGKEVGDLSNPRDAIVGAGKATLRNIAQFYKSSGEYAQRIGTENLGKILNSMDQKQMDQFVAAHINDTKASFSPDEQKNFDDYASSIFDKQKEKIKTEDVFKDLK